MGSYFEQRMEEIAAKPHLVATPPKPDGRRANEPVSPLVGTKRGTIYFVTYDQETVKIGFTTDLYSRMRTLQTGSPRRLFLVDRFRSYIEAERMLHSRFANARVNREWFEYTPEIEDFMDDIMDYQGCNSTGETGVEYVENMDNCFIGLNDLRIMLDNVGTPWQDIDPLPGMF